MTPSTGNYTNNNAALFHQMMGGPVSSSSGQEVRVHFKWFSDVRANAIYQSVNLRNLNRKNRLHCLELSSL